MNVLNEKAGIIEFDNGKYLNKIAEICEIISQKKRQTIYLPLFPEIPFAKYVFKDLNVSWIDTLVIYISNGADYFDAGALAGQDFSPTYFSYNASGNVEKGTIYIINDGEHNLFSIILHEIKHLYDHTHFKKIFFEDLAYYLDKRETYDITKYDLNTDVNDLSNEDILNILTECMNYANFTERHAYLENINFEIYSFLNSPVKSCYFLSKDKIFPKSSKTLYDIYILNYLVLEMLKLPDEVKEDAYYTHIKVYKTIYPHYSKLDDILKLYARKFKKILSHARIIFNNYYDNSFLKHVHSLSEGIRRGIQRGYNESKRRDLF